jgi:phospholipase C
VQLFGKPLSLETDRADMSGFLKDYSTTAAGLASANQIMQTFGPDEANVINDLARNFAVCDRWFASVPSQTWPNRGFFHTGSSDGHLNNDSYEWYHIPTIFNVLQDNGISWSVFYDATVVPSLTYWQLPYLGGYRDHFYGISDFKRLCAAGTDAAPADKLPQYSFIEPRFMPEFFGVEQPNDYHPPHNICRGEQFLAELYAAVRSSPYRDKILFFITFDEHGGCYDHVPPPTGAMAPQPCPYSRDGKFKFDRFGVRVPAIVVSSYVEPGTVFRATDGEPPYDHTSLLATLRDWLGLGAPDKFLPSPRIAAAPTLARVLTRARGNERADWPEITAKCKIDGSDVSPDTPLNDVQKSLVVAQQVQGAKADHVPAVQQVKKLQTYAHGAEYLAQLARQA